MIFILAVLLLLLLLLLMMMFCEKQGTVRVTKFILDSYNQLKQYDLSKKTLYIIIIQSLTDDTTGLI